MNEETEQPQDDEPEVEAPADSQAKHHGPLGGERLAEARRAQQISVLEIAKELHLDEPKVRALEKNEFDVLGAPVFAKGHLRKYAQLVGVDNDDVLADYYRLTRSQAMPPVVTQRRLPRSGVTPGPWIAAIVVLLIAAIAYVVLVVQPFAAPESDSTVEVPVTTDTPPDSDAASDVVSDDRQDAAVEEQAAEDQAIEDQAIDEAGQPDMPVQQDLPVADVEPVVPATATADGDVRLAVTFVGDCWTEITDASGRRLFFDLGRTGRTISVTGQAPLSVLFGDADNVSLQLNGNDFAIADADRRGRTARLMLYGS
jgi:cytoskeleton protein RodZ